MNETQTLIKELFEDQRDLMRRIHVLCKAGKGHQSYCQQLKLELVDVRNKIRRLRK